MNWMTPRLKWNRCLSKAKPCSKSMRRRSSPCCRIAVPDHGSLLVDISLCLPLYRLYASFPIDLDKFRTPCIAFVPHMRRDSPAFPVCCHCLSCCFEHPKRNYSIKSGNRLPHSALFHSSSAVTKIPHTTRTPTPAHRSINTFLPGQ